MLGHHIRSRNPCDTKLCGPAPDAGASARAPGRPDTALVHLVAPAGSEALLGLLKLAADVAPVSEEHGVSMVLAWWHHAPQLLLSRGFSHSAPDHDGPRLQAPGSGQAVGRDKPASGEPSSSLARPGSPEAAFSAREHASGCCPRLPQAALSCPRLPQDRSPTSLGQSAAWAALAGYTNRAWSEHGAARVLVRAHQPIAIRPLEQADLHLTSHTVAASNTYGCSLQHLRLQPHTPTVAASSTYGCSLEQGCGPASPWRCGRATRELAAAPRLRSMG